MRAAGVQRIAFSSTGSVYGEPEVFPTPEDAPFPVQTSLYGASKLAGEGLIAAYATGFGFTGLIFRFVSILGERYTHGHVFDFYRALKRDPTRLRVLGDGRQEKSYLYVQDCIDAILLGRRASRRGAGRSHLQPRHRRNRRRGRLGGDHRRASGALAGDRAHRRRRGWIGDSPLIYLDTHAIRGLGWQPKLTIREAVVRTLEWFDANEYAWRGRGRTMTAVRIGATR